MAETKEPRIERLTVEEAKRRAEEIGLAPAFGELNVFRVLLHHPTLTKAIADLLVTLLYRGVLDARLRELAIMRIGWVTGSEYEWTQHWAVALGLDVPADDLLALRDWRASDRFSPADRAVLAATDDTLETGAIRPETWAACEQQLASAEERLELVAAIGNWRLFSQLLRSLEIPLEEGTEPWPPDGRSGGAPSRV